MTSELKKIYITDFSDKEKYGVPVGNPDGTAYVVYASEIYNEMTDEYDPDGLDYHYLPTSKCGEAPTFRPKLESITEKRDCNLFEAWAKGVFNTNETINKFMKIHKLTEKPTPADFIYYMNWLGYFRKEDVAKDAEYIQFRES